MSLNKLKQSLISDLFNFWNQSQCHITLQYCLQSHWNVRANFISRDDEGGYSLAQGAYAQSGPPAANGTDGAATEQQLEGATAIPTYAVVDKSKKKKKLRKEVPPVYAEVDKSKKKKKKIDDKNLYENLNEPKKVCIFVILFYYTAFIHLQIKFKYVPLVHSKSFRMDTGRQKWTQVLLNTYSSFQSTEEKPIPKK